MAAKPQKPNPLAPVDDAARAYADNQALLAAKVAEVEAEVAEVYRRHHKEITVLSIAEATARLDAIRAVDANRSLFAGPKSRVLHGVKVGLRKGQDVLNLGDEDRLIDRIRDLMPEKAGQLVKEAATVVKSAVKALPRADLKRLGVKYVEGADEPFVTVEKSDAAKAAQAILDSIQE